MIRKICFILFFQLCLAVPATGADFITVAVAANFTTTLEGIVQLYEKRYGRDVRVTIASSGTLYAQLSNGDPFDIFLSKEPNPSTMICRFCQFRRGAKHERIN